MKFFPARRRASLAAALALAGALALGQAPHALAAGSDALQALIDQGKYWQAHGRSDLAEQAWKKVLGIDAKQPDALLGMGFVMADRKDGGQSAAYLDRLRQVAPNYPGIDELGRRLGQSSPRDQTVNDARRLAQSGRSASAVEQYQKAMDGAPATPELRLEYYQALAATPNGWDEARKGLETLARDNPDDPRYALAYAQHLTYRDVTRRDGIARLQQLTGDAKFGPAGPRELAAGAAVAGRAAFRPADVRRLLQARAERPGGEGALRRDGAAGEGQRRAQRAAGGRQRARARASATASRRSTATTSLPRARASTPCSPARRTTPTRWAASASSS